jgi:1-acyl-sn-glycerol-3-phosphate acyltransferase
MVMSDPARDALVEQILEFARSRPAAERDAVRERLHEVLAEAGPARVAQLVERVLRTGSAWGYHPPEPLARDLQHTLAQVVLGEGSRVDVPFDLNPAAFPDGASVVLLSNHLSYSDANLVEILLRRAGHAGLTDRLTVIAGPKVYSDPVRRFSSLSFGTIKTPQSTARSSEEAIMSPRDVARVALEAIAIARTRQAAGDVLLLFVEGTRSRTGGMQRALPAVARYFDSPGTLLVPVGIVGSEALVPVGDEHLQRGDVSITLGAPVRSEVLFEAAEGNRRLVVDAIGIAIAALLPPAYRGEYGQGGPDLDAASAIARGVFEGARAPLLDGP